MKLDKRKAQLFIGIGALGLLCVLILASITLSFLDIRADKVSIAAERSLLALNQQRVAKLEGTRARAGRLEEEIGLYRRLLPQGISQNETFAQLHRLSQDHQVEILRLRFLDAQQAGESVGKLPYELELRGPYGSVMAVLEEVVSSGRLAGVEELEIHSVSGQANGSVTAQATVAVYYGQ